MSSTDISNGTKIDRWIIATGVDPRMPNIPGMHHPNVLRSGTGLLSLVLVGSDLMFPSICFITTSDDQDKRVNDLESLHH